MFFFFQIDVFDGEAEACATNWPAVSRGRNEIPSKLIPVSFLSLAKICLLWWPRDYLASTAQHSALSSGLFACTKLVLNYPPRGSKEIDAVPGAQRRVKGFNRTLWQADRWSAWRPKHAEQTFASDRLQPKHRRNTNNTTILVELKGNSTHTKKY